MSTPVNILFLMSKSCFLTHLLPEKSCHVAFPKLDSPECHALLREGCWNPSELNCSLLVINPSASLRLISSCGLFSGSRYSPNHDKCLSCSHHQFSLRREFVIEVPSLLCEVHQEVNSHSLEEMHDLNNKRNANGSFGLETKTPDGS